MKAVDVTPQKNTQSNKRPIQCARLWIQHPERAWGHWLMGLLVSECPQPRRGADGMFAESMKDQATSPSTLLAPRARAQSVLTGEIVAFEFPEAGAGLVSAQEEGGLRHVLPHPCDGS